MAPIMGVLTYILGQKYITGTPSSTSMISEVRPGGGWYGYLGMFLVAGFICWVVMLWEFALEYDDEENFRRTCGLWKEEAREWGGYERLWGWSGEEVERAVKMGLWL